MANFNLGDNVYLKKGLYIPNEHNPTNTLGVIESYETGRDSHPYRVRWSNGEDNTYNKTDLILANKEAKPGDLIQVLNTVGAMWLRSGHEYLVEAVDPPNDKIKVGGQFWSCQSTDYTILSSQAGESTTDADVQAYKEKVRKEVLLKEAKELYPPGTKFINKQGSISVISDNPEYTHSSSKDGIYARTVTGKLVYIYYDGEWYDIVKGEPIVTSTPRARLKAGDRIYIKRMVKHKGGVSEYAGRVMTIAYEPYWYGDGSYHITFTETPKRGFVVYPDEWEPATDTSKQIYDVRYGPESSTYEEFLDKYFYKNKNQINGTESSKQSVKLQGINLQIREGNSIRGIGLKSSGSKIKLGSDYRYN